MATRHTYSGSTQRFNGNLSGEQGQQDQGGMMEKMSSAGEAIQSQAQHYVEDYPISTVLTVFGIGLGVGVALGSMMSSSRSSDWSLGSSSWLPSSSSSGSWFPSMSSSSSPWQPSSSHSWFSGHQPHSWFAGSQQPHSWFSSQPSSWSDSLMRGAKHMFGSSNY